jgi:Phage major capsid protein E
MTQQTLTQARVYDPILTEVARGFRSPKAPIADVLFPIVEVGQRGGRIIAFGPDDFRLAMTKRAPGANTKRVQFGYASEPYALTDYSLEGAVPIELMQDARAVPGIDLAAVAIRRVRNQMAIEREKEAVDLAVNPGNFAADHKLTLTGGDQWSDYTNSDPFDDVNTGREIIRAKTGERPNVMVVAPKVLTALRSNPKVLNRLSTASDRPPATLAQLAALFEFDRIVEAPGMYYNGSAFVDMFGKSALLAYTLPASQAEMGSPNFGYTYQLAGYPLVEEPYQERNPKTWYYPNTDARQAVLTGPTAGYLILQAVA